MKVNFTYYLHDDYSGFERADYILNQLPEEIQAEHDTESFSELIGRPFYEITLDCQLDTETGDVKILATR